MKAVTRPLPGHAFSMRYGWLLMAGVVMNNNDKIMEVSGTIEIYYRQWDFFCNRFFLMTITYFHYNVFHHQGGSHHDR
jgi:hypothetical protein